MENELWCVSYSPDQQTMDVDTLRGYLKKNWDTRIMNPGGTNEWILVFVANSGREASAFAREPLEAMFKKLFLNGRPSWEDMKIRIQPSAHRG
ncbi:MAG: hypothetical protein WC530_10470 [Candidatus Omnitrophota bacterium]